MRLRQPLLVAALLLTSACGGQTDDRAADTAPTQAPATESTSGSTAPPAGEIGAVAEDDAALHLWVSNQSFEDDPVHVTVEIDGVTVADDDFEVGSQHNWILFPLRVPPGAHEVVATSGTGAILEKTFRIPRSGDPRYAVVDYWNYDDADGRHLDWTFEDEPLAFG